MLRVADPFLCDIARDGHCRCHPSRTANTDADVTVTGTCSNH
jgi:hypothetical protein